jgi:mRNA-degrading endonuclease RelE of RelBE toxin-antitoxin system
MKIKFTPTADKQLTELEKAPSKAALAAQVRKSLENLEIDPHHPSLRTHEFLSLTGLNG